MVDRVIKKKKWPPRKILTIAGIAALVLLAFGSYYFTSGKSRLNQDLDRLTISTVTKGPFQETIPVNGTVLPIKSIYLDATEGGRVEEKYVEDGTFMKKGQPILRLSNTNLELNLAGQETNVFTQLSQMQLARINAQQNTVSKLTQMADVESSFKEAERIYNLDKTLFAQKAIGSQEFKQAENNYNYYLEKEKLAREILKQDTVSTKQQTEQDKESYEHAQSGLAIMRKKVGDLILRSPIEGQLTSLDAEVGQSKKEGDRLGQIDVLSGFKVQVDVDQHYISRIYNGLTGVFNFADSNYNLRIFKVYTQVTNGHFQVDMQFVGKVPKGIRRGQTLQILLALSEARQSVLVPRGGFYNQTGGNWIFKVSDDGKTAYRADIQLGNQNPEYYEVLQGLKPGDKVVTSSYENYGNIQELVLKK
ncbi:MAG: HlyD family efflux transporter periplasmic adaptor subunit [Bacteroidota bacterium]|nr:HlyD family efflux transporter periplasmic adaptor subunit [Bacteroidota bacterium]MDP4249840.1 HlyD family efflux transporter periplasmic adaptor subunit [Bacteroidota bacterium]